MRLVGWLGWVFVGWGWEACVDGWMDTFFSSRLSLSPLLLSLFPSLSVRATRYPREERTVLHDPVKVDIPEEHTHTRMHTYI